MVVSPERQAIAGRKDSGAAACKLAQTRATGSAEHLKGCPTHLLEFVKVGLEE
jgi:hypothetical protein